MLASLSVKQAQRIAELANAARKARDGLLGNVPEKTVGDPPAARGEHNPTATLGYSPLSPGAPSLRELQSAVDSLEPAARAELFAVLRIGQSDLAAGDWEGLLEEADLLGDKTIAAVLIEDPDLHDHLVKGLYELKASR
jgi:hypothetical protein